MNSIIVLAFRVIPLLADSQRGDIPVTTKPYRGDQPVTTLSTISPTGDDLGCGGIAFCKRYQPDPCNTCRCAFDGRAPAMCTRMFCEEKYDALQCIDCMDGYELNEEGQCIESKVTNPNTLCVCPMMYAPVCCDGGITFDSQCNADCEDHTNCVQGPCESVTAEQHNSKSEPLEDAVPEMEVDVFCAMNVYCASYNDGCNDCICSTDGTTSCTMKMCLNEDTLPPPQCMQCRDGYDYMRDRVSWNKHHQNH